MIITNTNRFFHLPSLYVYLLAAVLLVTSVFHAAALVRHGLYALLGFNEISTGYYYDRDLVQLTPDAQAHMDQLQSTRQKQSDLADVLRSFILLALSLGFFYFFWKRTVPSADVEMVFTVRNFYFFLVSSIAFLIFFFSVSAGVNTVVDMTVRPDYHYYNLHAPRAPGETPQPVTLNLEQLKERLAEQDRQRQEATGRSNHTRRLVDQLTVSLVALPLFYWHNKQLQPQEVQNS